MGDEVATSKFKQLRRSYGFDEVAIVPGDITINPDQTNVDFKIGTYTFSIPVIAAATPKRTGGTRDMAREGLTVTASVPTFGKSSLSKETGERYSQDVPPTSFSP